MNIFVYIFFFQSSPSKGDKLITCKSKNSQYDTAVLKLRSVFFFTAVYLVAIFTASTFSIVFVIWIAKIADYESNMSPCTKSIASWLARIPCCGKHPKSGCRRKRSVSISAAKGEELRENGRFSRNNSRVDSDPSPDNDAGEICGGDVITWQDFASSLDQILFVFFFIFIAVSSLVLFIFWGLEYERNN